MEKEKTMETKKFRDMVRKMIDDKKAISSYIREHGTLEGFSDPSIKFARPI